MRSFVASLDDSVSKVERYDLAIHEPAIARNSDMDWHAVDGTPQKLSELAGRLFNFGASGPNFPGSASCNRRGTGHICRDAISDRRSINRWGDVDDDFLGKLGHH